MSMSFWMPASFLMALSTIAAVATILREDLPVTMLPSGSCIADTTTFSYLCGFCALLISAYSSAAATAGLSYLEAPTSSISSLHLSRVAASIVPFLYEHSAIRYLRMISCLAASLQTASSVMANPHLFTPMSVGDLYPSSDPVIAWRILLSTGNASTSLL